MRSRAAGSGVPFPDGFPAPGGTGAFVSGLPSMMMPLWDCSLE